MKYSGSWNRHKRRKMSSEFVPRAPIGTTQKTRFVGPTWGPHLVLSAPDGPHIGPMNLAIRVCTQNALHHHDGYRYLSTKWGPDQRQPPFWHCNRRITRTYSSLITYPLCGYLMRQNLCRTRPKYYHNNKCHCKKRRKKRALTVIFNAQIWKRVPPPPPPPPHPPPPTKKSQKNRCYDKTQNLCRVIYLPLNWHNISWLHRENWIDECQNCPAH